METRSISFLWALALTLLGAGNFMPAAAQSASAYFQQEVQTVIRVQLDDTQHKLKGTIYIDYINHSPHILDTLWFHLWANAYQTKNSAFARQKLDHKDARFYFTGAENMGGYDSITFFLEGKRARWGYHPEHRDIAYLVPEKGLAPGASTSISAPFVIRIPGSFSRFGHEGQSYQVTQWFPKPAVFDRDGWHPMPYLDMGEFYSEFGDYDVSITLPENYFVAATGSLQTDSELNRISRRIEYTANYLDTTLFYKSKAFPPSSGELKTIRFIAEKVHDFAWFADKRFLIGERELILHDTDTVKAQIFFLPDRHRLWIKGLDYVERGLLYYDSLVGPYPYPKVAAVEGALEAGSGMEYPMITVIGKQNTAASLDQVITHEIGHNWFYGILANNEREHPWMDEGINSYYDHRYQKSYYPHSLPIQKLPPFLRSLATFDWIGGYHAFAHQKALAQSSALPSEEYTMFNYFLGLYENPARSFHYLEQYLGETRFDSIMQSCYLDWSFRHIKPDDFQHYWESASGESLDWFFQGLLGDIRSFDYALKGIETIDSGYQLKISNQTGYSIPFQLAGYQNDSLVFSAWIRGFNGDSLITVASPMAERWVLDPDQLYPDPNRSDNYRNSGGWFKSSRPVTLGFMDVTNDPGQQQISWLPTAGWNESDGVMLGLLFFNTSFPNQNNQFMIHPMYALGNKAFSSAFSSNLTGQAKWSYDWFRDRPLRQIRGSLAAKSFHFDYPNTIGIRYTKIKPELRFTFNPNLTDQQSLELSFYGDFISEDYPEGTFSAARYSDAEFVGITLSKKDHRMMLPSNWELKLEAGSSEAYPFPDKEQYLRLEAGFQTKILYGLNKSIDIRLYGGSRLWSNTGKSSVTKAGTLGLIGYARNDYRYEDFFFDRGAQEGIWANQVNLTGGGFKTAVNPAYGIGQSNLYVAALNLKADLPFQIPLLNGFKLFFDLGAYGYLPTLTENYKNQWAYSGGLMIDSFEGVLNLYLPLINSREIENAYAENKWYLNRISFSMNLNIFNFSKLLDRDDLLFGQ